MFRRANMREAHRIRRLPRMMMKVQQQHVSHKAHDKPERGFHDSFKLRCHEESIP